MAGESLSCAPAPHLGLWASLQFPPTPRFSFARGTPCTPLSRTKMMGPPSNQGFLQFHPPSVLPTGSWLCLMVGGGNGLAEVEFS